MPAPTGSSRSVGSAVPVLLLALTLAACAPDAKSPLAPPAERSLDVTTTRADGGRIAWVQYVAYTGLAITSAHLDGSDERQLTNPVPGVFDDGHPVYTPDGKSIVFAREYSGDLGVAQLERMNADGTGITQIGDCTGDCLGNMFPAVSPDGKRIAFIRWMGPVRPDGQATSGGVWLINIDGTNPVQITQLHLPTTTEDSHPAWSPDGTHIVFMRLNTVAEPQWHQAVYVARADGKDIHRITPWALDANAPAWSPDGKVILVASHSDAYFPGVGELYTVRPDGSALTRIRIPGLTVPPNTSILANNGRYSSDGSSIVFNHQLFPDECCVIYTMRSDGSDVARVSLSDQAAFAPTWEPRR
jgi:Tol biopolymer transport system component